MEPKRTLCEKIMSLVRFSYSETPIDDLKKKTRHAFDLHQMLLNKELNEFFMANDFEILLLKVANEGITSFKNNNSWLINHPKKAMVFAEVNEVWDLLKTTYNTSFKNLVFGNFPKESEILKTLLTIKERLDRIDWAVKLD